jgi:SAM-dependent methyltransferase
METSMHDDGYFDETVAPNYDKIHGSDDLTKTKPMVDFLSQLSGNYDILEFAIGTGRVALPLASRGHRVSGIERSNAMVAELRKKKQNEAIEVVIGDMTTSKVSGQFSLVFLVFNTVDNLTSQKAQIACFQNAADHLTKGGRFVIETLLPPIQNLPFGETKLAFSCSEDHFGIDEFDVVTQTYSSNHIRKRDMSYQHFSVPFRYAWPSELDLMAQMAGLKLENRWGDWDKSAFSKLSRKHISVWVKK